MGEKQGIELNKYFTHMQLEAIREIGQRAIEKHFEPQIKTAFQYQQEDAFKSIAKHVEHLKTADPQSEEKRKQQQEDTVDAFAYNAHAEDFLAEMRAKQKEKDRAENTDAKIAEYKAEAKYWCTQSSGWESEYKKTVTELKDANQYIENMQRLNDHLASELEFGRLEAKYWRLRAKRNEPSEHAE